MAVEYMSKRGIKAAMIPPAELDKYEKEGKEIICAINYLSVKPGLEKELKKKSKSCAV